VSEPLAARNLRSPRGLLARSAARLAGLAHAPAWTLTALAGLAYLIAAPASADLATASYRSWLFGRSGFTLWDNSWYGGHHLPAYSVLAPALGWLLGPRLLAVLSLIAATALFAALVRSAFAPRVARLAALWFALGAAIALLSCRVAFDLGLAAGLGSLLLAQRGRHGAALALAVACALASPVAGGFLALAGLAWLLALRPGWPAPALIAGALVPTALLALAFPEGGSQPFVASAFYPALAAVLLLVAVTPRARPGSPATPTAGAPARSLALLRTGALLYAAALIGAYVLETPAGGNVDRLGALVAGPVAACILAGAGRARGRAGRWRTYLLIGLAPALTYWQATAPVTDLVAAVGDPAVKASYYQPLLAELGRLGVGYGARPARVEVVATVNHWEARFLAPHAAIARGWERQLDRRRNSLFYDGPLTAARYRAWLADEGISYVALPDASLDYSAKAEARVARSGAGQALREIWRSAHWRLFAVRGASALAQPPALLTQLGSDSFTLRAPRAGDYTVRVRFTPYWRLASGAGCVRRAGGDWTALQARRAGTLHVEIGFSLQRVFEHGPRCS
jgi:hypothetical protein